MDFKIENILRALLFSTSNFLSIKDVQTVITRYHGQADKHKAAGGIPTNSPGGNSGKAAGPPPAFLTATQIRNAMETIKRDLDEQGSVFRLAQGPGGYRLAIEPQYAGWVRLLRDEPKPYKLSPASMETLAIIAYRQPITRADLESIRGVSSDSALNTNLEHDLVKATGRADSPGRPIQYGTTHKFLEFCGLSSLDELPASDVLSPNQLTNWIRQASIEQSELTDSDFGLAEEEDAET